MEREKRIKAFFQERHQQMLQFLEELVMIESGTYQKEGIDEVGLLLRERLEGLGFSTREFSQEEYGDHLLLSKQGQGEGRLLLMGHMDTVFDAGITERFPFQLREGSAFGPGVSDMKGGLVNICFGMEALTMLNFNSFGEILILLNSDEEIGSPTSGPIIEELASTIEGAFLLEPARSNGALVTERKGLGLGTLRVKGRASHAGSNPHEGISAVEELAYQILSLSSLEDLERGLSMNIGRVKGGSRVNVVAEEAEAELEFRFFKREDGEMLLKKMKEMVREKRFRESSVELEAEIERLPIEKTKESKRLFSLVREAGDELGIDVQEEHTGGLSDGNLLAVKGVPLVDAMGPIGFNAHSQEEHLYVESIPERAALLVLSIMNFFLRGSPR